MEKNNYCYIIFRNLKYDVKHKLLVIKWTWKIKSIL